MIAVPDNTGEEFCESEDAPEFSRFDWRGVAAHTLQDGELFADGLEPGDSAGDFIGGTCAGRDDERLAGGGEGIEERAIDDVRTGGFVRVPWEFLGDGDEFDTEDADDGVDTEFVGERDAGCHVLDRKLESTEHFDGVGFAGGFLVCREFGGATHEHVGLEQLELDGVGTRGGGQSCELQRAGGRAIVIHAEFGDDVRRGVACDGA